MNQQTLQPAYSHKNLMISGQPVLTSKQKPGQSTLLLYSVESDIPCLHVLKKTKKKSSAIGFLSPRIIPPKKEDEASEFFPTQQWPAKSIGMRTCRGGPSVSPALLPAARRRDHFACSLKEAARAPTSLEDLSETRCSWKGCSNQSSNQSQALGLISYLYSRPF